MVLSKLKEFLWGIAIKKGVVAGAKALVGLLAVKAGLLSTFGVTIDLGTFEATAAATLIGGLESLRNTLKVKYGVAWI